MLGAAKAAAGAATGTAAAKAVAVTGVSTVVALTVIVSSLLTGMGGTAAAGSTCGPEGGGGGGESGVSAPQVSQEPSETAVADIPADYLKLYQSAGTEFGIDSMILAAVGKIETNHGEDILNEGSGAAGPMQFMPSTWETAGLDANGDGVADINDPQDAIPSAAKYLRDSGAPEDYYTALFAYNNSDEYVNTVLAQADEYRAASGDDSTLALLQPAYGAVAQGLADRVASGADLLGEAAASPFTVRSADATMNSWDLVDENLNLHYESHTQFGSAVSHGASAWNGLGPVNIAPSPGGDETDVVIGDTYEEAAEYGWTTSDGRMYFVAYKAENSTENAVNALAAHELGHAVGFDHTSEASVMNTPITTNSDSNYDTATDYDRGEYAARWGGEESSSPEENSSPAPTPEEGEGGGSGGSGPEGGTFEGDEDEGPSPDTGSQELFEHMFGGGYGGTSTNDGDVNTNSNDGDGGSEEGNVNRQVQINNNSSQTDGGDSGGGGKNEVDISDDPDGNNTGWPFNIFGGENDPQGDSDGGGKNKGNDDGDSPTKNQYGDQEGGGGEEGGAKAVFPLPGDYQDDYQDDWGAARSQGGHEGTDIFAPDGTNIASITDGTVVKSGWDELGGNTVLIEASNDVGPVKAGDVMYYAHMQGESPLKAGDTVAAGDSVGQVGSTGEGPPGTLLPDGRGQHLHLGWYDESGSRAEAASGAMNPFPLLEWLVDNGGEATGGPTAPGYCPDEEGGSPSGTPGSTPESSPEGGSTGGGDGAAAVEEAKKYMGVPYVLGDESQCIPGEQMDCTCLTTTVYAAVGDYQLPDWPQALHDYGEPVDSESIQAGDAVIYADPGDGTGGHVGIAINSTEMIHACLPCGEVVIGPIFDVPNFNGARRLL